MSSYRQAILMVEGNPADAKVLTDILTEIDEPQWLLTHVERLRDGVTQLLHNHFDLVLLNLSLPDSQGLDTITLFQFYAPDIPIVVLTGNDDRELALQAVAKGVQDYLVKGKLSTELLERAIRFALQRGQIIKQLQESERRFRKIFEQAFQSMCLLTPEGIILEVNQTALNSYGFEPKDCLGLPLWEVRFFNESEATREWLKTAIANSCDGQLARHELQVCGPLDVIVWIDCSIKPVKNPTEKVTLLIVEYRNISSRKIAEAEIKKALEQERELNQLKSDFVSMVSHEFRNPMTTVRMSVEMLQHYNHKLTDEKKNQHFERTKTAISNMLQLLDEILIIGKAEAGRLQYSPIPLDLENFCDTLTETLQLSIASHHKITFTCQGECTKAEMDEFLLQHILTNLLSNAIKYSPAGSNVKFNLICQTGQAIFQIQDQGIGIPPIEQQLLFENFHRCSNVGRIPGTGLGLSIVKKCVDLHMGQIDVKSEVEVGTTFTVTLPLENCGPCDNWKTNARILPTQRTLQGREFTSF